MSDEATTIYPEDRLQLGELLAPNITDLIENRQTHAAREALQELLPPELADVIVCLSPQHRAVTFRLLSKDLAADVFTVMSTEAQDELIEELSHEQLAQLFNEIDPDDRVELFEEMPGKLVTKVLSLMRPEERRLTQIILGYPEESIGRIMTPEYLTIQSSWTASEARRHIRANRDKVETLDYIYMIDENGVLVDHVDLIDIFLADPGAVCDELRQGNTVSLRAKDDQEEAVYMMERYDLHVMPVVDRDGVMVGIVTFDDVADIAMEEVTEDIHKMSGMEALDEPYISTPLMLLFKKRVVWLAILFLGQMLTVSAMGMFEENLQKAVILALFIPLIIASGGNSGSQTTSLIIRAMAVGEIALKDWRRVLMRELYSGLMLGGTLGLLGFIRVLVGQYWLNDVYTAHPVPVGITVSLALMGIVLCGTVVGSMLPFMLAKLKFDPATSSSPFVTTIVDVTGLFIYFIAALIILKGSVL